MYLYNHQLSVLGRNGVTMGIPALDLIIVEQAAG
jgi:hypothetical protein